MLSAGENSEGNDWYCEKMVCMCRQKKRIKKIAHKNKEKKRTSYEKYVKMKMEKRNKYDTEGKRF